jgi:hypothetical protein
MTLDPEHHRAFVACEGNDLMTVFDLDKHAPIAFLPMAGGPDVIKFDAGLKRIYVACGSGAFPSSKWMIRIITESSKTFPSKRRSTVSPSIRKHTASMRPNRKPTAKPWRA